MNAVESLNFEGWQVRHIVIEGVAWFVASDVASVLGYVNPGKAVRDHCKGGPKQTPLLTAGGTQQVRVISESDVMRLIVSSKLPAAEQFEKWLFEVVLTEIRRTGSFSTAPALPVSYADALRELALTVESKERLELQAERDAPKVAYVETFVTDGDLRILRNVAKSLGMTEGELRTDLITRKWIYAEHTTRWSEVKQAKESVTRYSPYSDKTQYFTPVPNHNAPRFKGEVMHTLKITPAGAVAIARLYGKTAYLVAQAVTS